MEQTVNWEVSKEEAGRLSALLEQCVKFIRESNERSALAEPERERLQAETRELLSQIRRALNVETSA
jgi:hypothetical protein